MGREHIQSQHVLEEGVWSEPLNAKLLAVDFPHTWPPHWMHIPAHCQPSSIHRQFTIMIYKHIFSYEHGNNSEVTEVCLFIYCRIKIKTVKIGMLTISFWRFRCLLLWKFSTASLAKPHRLETPTLLFHKRKKNILIVSLIDRNLFATSKVFRARKSITTKWVFTTLIIIFRADLLIWFGLPARAGLANWQTCNLPVSGAPMGKCIFNYFCCQYHYTG